MIVVALVFFAAGIPKLFIYRDWLFRFYVWDYPKWLLIVVGIVETAGAAAILIRRTVFAGAVALSLIMVGAFITHFTHREGLVMLRPLVMLALLYFILKKTKPRNLMTKLRGLISKSATDADH